MSTCKIDATASAARSSSGPCLARNRAISGMRLAYSRFSTAFNFLRVRNSSWPSSFFGGDDAIDAGQILGYADVCPVGKIQKWLDGGEAVVAKFEDEKAPRF